MPDVSLYHCMRREKRKGPAARRAPRRDDRAEPALLLLPCQALPPRGPATALLAYCCAEDGVVPSTTACATSRIVSRRSIDVF